MYILWYFVAFYTVLFQKVSFFAIHAVFRKISLLQFTRYRVEKILAKNSARGEKMTNIRYAPYLSKIMGLFQLNRHRSFSTRPSLETTYAAYQKSSI